MSRPASIEVTPRQQEILAWVKAFIHDHGMPPTVREIGRAFRIDSSSVFYLLKQLERKGYLRRGNLGARSLILEEQKPVVHASAKIRVMGRIAAGQPIEAVEHHFKTLRLNVDVLRGYEGHALEVIGKSMIEDGIFDGDYVIIRKQETADNGDVVVALLNGDATLKRLRRQRNAIILEPANSEIKPIPVKPEDDLKIQGKVVAIYREL